MDQFYSLNHIFWDFTIKINIQTIRALRYAKIVQQKHLPEIKLDKVNVKHVGVVKYLATTKAKTNVSLVRDLIQIIQPVHIPLFQEMKDRNVMLVRPVQNVMV